MSATPTFPVSVEGFIDYQQQLCGRALGKYERGALEIWVPIFNDSYEDGKKNDQETLAASIRAMDRVIAKRGNSETLSRFLKVSRDWIAFAWKCGREEAQI